MPSVTVAADVLAELRRHATRVRCEVPLAEQCTFHIGGPAELYVEVASREELRQALSILRHLKLPCFLLGAGSNVLFCDHGFPGAVVRLRGQLAEYTIEGTSLVAGAGAMLPFVVKGAVEAGLGGVESLVGVPGTLGGALVMNAGTSEGAIGELVNAVEVMGPDGEGTTLSRHELSFGYRTSSLGGSVVVGATLRFLPSDRQALRQRVSALLKLRAETQPLGTFNVGSIFKNPPGDRAGRLIEAVGLKGHRIGGAQISPRHANFIVNVDRATARDVSLLIAEAQRRVRDCFQLELEPEIKIVGPQGT
ncbi:MAG: UDP-N-acetylmuramate dehydrogenase [Elusimicrobia bacterium]|nr:UDP-N-acetylmuramate dehydrogenase [Elusimicrobiota bacterium]